MRSLMTEALNLPLQMMELIQHEMRRLPVLPLSLHLPVHGTLSVLCRQLSNSPAFTRLSMHGPTRSA